MIKQQRWSVLLFLTFHLRKCKNAFRVGLSISLFISYKNKYYTKSGNFKYFGPVFSRIIINAQYVHSNCLLFWKPVPTLLNNLIIHLCGIFIHVIYSLVVVWTQGYSKSYPTDFVPIFTKPPL